MSPVPALPSVDIVKAPLDPVEIDMPPPATRYSDPSVSVVREPLNPALNPTDPLNVVPDTVATTLSSTENSVLERLRPVPAVYVVFVSVDDIDICPDDPVEMVTLLPAARYDVPLDRFCNEPDKPDDATTFPENVVPETVATTLSSILRVTAPDVPPPERPVPAVTAVISPVPAAVDEIVIAPDEPVEIVTFDPAIR